MMDLGKGGRAEGKGMKSFRNYSRPEPRKFGNATIIASMIFSLCVLSLVKARYCPSPSSAKTQVPLQLQGHMVRDVKLETDDNIEDEDPEVNTVINTAVDTISKPICLETSGRSETCEAQGDIRIQTSSNAIYIHPSSTIQQEWKIKPYPRKGDVVALATVKEWSIKPIAAQQNPPRCTANHSVPAVIFSIAGFTGNLFHDFTDVLVPLFISSHQFKGEVQFIIAESKQWWVNKFSLILKRLSHHSIIDLNTDREQVHCFPRVIAGPSFHKELGVNPSKTPDGYSAVDFKKLLRASLGLERSSAMTELGGNGNAEGRRVRPRLLIISRKNSRVFVNENGMVAMATSLGFDVRVGEPDINTDLSKFARLVNSADVMIGAHGAGLTNMVFLPEGAVLIQVVPFGGLEWIARRSFGEPATDMRIKYLEYMVGVEESTLIEQYPKGHSVLNDPFSVHKQGWDALKFVYLDKQNLRPHLGRLKGTLMEAHKFLTSK